jgi:ATP-dependent DNA ligase
MEARSVDAIPEGRDWQYEPKWDGFRCLLSREGDRWRLDKAPRQCSFEQLKQKAADPMKLLT